MEPTILHVNPMFDQATLEQLRAELTPIIQRADPTVGGAERPRLPGLQFKAEQAGKSFKLHFDATSGEVRAEPMPPMPPWSFLERLHRDAGGYTARPWARKAWAVLSDLVALSLCFWTLTGLVMWSQLKTVRRVGSIVVVAAMVIAVLVGSGMWRIFTS